jgi:hypothetical protein
LCGPTFKLLGLITPWRSTDNSYWADFFISMFSYDDVASRAILRRSKS